MDKLHGGKVVDDEEVEPKLMAEMSEQRTKFLKEFAIKRNLKDKDFDEALVGKRGIPGVVSIPKGLKRENDDDT
jgi:hypothetical protein